MEKFSLMDGSISAVMHYASSDKFIICCHGLYSSKDSTKYTELADLAQKEGISVIRFDFRGCGESAGSMHDSILSSRITDLQEVIRYTRKQFSSSSIALFGSSFGGLVSIITSSIDKKIASLAVLSTPYEIKDDLGMGMKFMEDLKKYNILDTVGQTPPILIIHGRKDELVPIGHAEKLYANACHDKKILFFDADHSFSTSRKESLAASLEWIKKHF